MPKTHCVLHLCCTLALPTLERLKSSLDQQQQLEVLQFEGDSNDCLAVTAALQTVTGGEKDVVAWK